MKARTENLTKRCAAVVVCAGLLLVGVDSRADPEAGARPEIPDDIKQSVRQRIDNGYAVGIVVGVINPQGTQYYGYGKTGLPDGDPPDENTIFEIGSVTKVFTGLLLADMAERKEIALDDPIEKHLPDGVRAPTRKGKSIHLVHLSTHRSGLPRLPDNMAAARRDDPYADYAAGQMYEFLSSYKLPRDVGEKYEYSNYGVGLLGELLARRAGQTYEQLVRQRITDKLGMPDTLISLTPEMQKRLARGHRGETEVPPWNFRCMAGAGALRSTAHDMLTFLAANMRLSDSPLSRPMDQTQQARRQAGRDGLQVGLGWHVLTRGGRQIYWHNGGTGGYSSFIGFDKADRTGIAVLSNSAHSVDDIGLHFFLPKSPLRAFAEPARPIKVVPVDLLPGEKLPAGQDIVERSIEQTGGREKLARIRNRFIKASVQLKTPRGGTSAAPWSYIRHARTNITPRLSFPPWVR